jgi:hypothetical protein
MSYPKAYNPQQGYKYQILTCYQGQREWEHLDYAVDAKEKNYLLGEYRLGMVRQGFAFKTILLPAKYWPKKEG